MKEEVEVEQPQGFVIQGHEENVYKLNKVLYELNKHLEHGIVRVIATLKEKDLKKQE